MNNPNYNPANRSVTTGTDASATWPGWLGVLGGIWLIAAPFILNYSNYTTPLYNDIIVGIVAIVLTGFCALTAGRSDTFQARRAAGGLAAIAGIWLIVAPFVLNYSSLNNFLWNDIITGVLFLVIAGYAVSYHAPRYTATGIR